MELPLTRLRATEGCSSHTCKCRAILCNYDLGTNDNLWLRPFHPPRGVLGPEGPKNSSRGMEGSQIYGFGGRFPAKIDGLLRTSAFSSLVLWQKPTKTHKKSLSYQGMKDEPEAFLPDFFFFAPSSWGDGRPRIWVMDVRTKMLVFLRCVQLAGYFSNEILANSDFPAFNRLQFLTIHSG